MCGMPSVQQPDEFALAKKREKRETLAAVASQIRAGSSGAKLLRRPLFPLKKQNEVT